VSVEKGESEQRHESSLFLGYFVKLLRFTLRNTLRKRHRMRTRSSRGRKRKRKTYSSMNQINRMLPLFRPNRQIPLFLPLPLLPGRVLRFLEFFPDHLHRILINRQTIRPNLFDTLRDFWFFQFLEVLTTLFEHWTERDEGTPEGRVVRRRGSIETCSKGSGGRCERKVVSQVERIGT